MVSRSKFGGLPLITPVFHVSDARATGLLCANAMRQSYLYAQSQGVMLGVQAFAEVDMLTEVDRTLQENDWARVAHFSARLPRHARRVRAACRYNVFGALATIHTDPSTGVVPTDAWVYHRVSVNTDVGPEQKDGIRTTNPFVVNFGPGSDSREVDPGAAGFFHPFDTQQLQSECFVDLDDSLPLTEENDTEISIEAYAVDTQARSVYATASSRTSNVLTATVENGKHGIVVGDEIWMDGEWDRLVPQASPVEVTSTTYDPNTISWTDVGADDADTGVGTIFTVAGVPLTYRPGLYAIWWEY